MTPIYNVLLVIERVDPELPTEDEDAHEIISETTMLCWDFRQEVELLVDNLTNQEWLTPDERIQIYAQLDANAAEDDDIIEEYIEGALAANWEEDDW